MLAVPGTTSLRKVTVRTSEPDALAVRTQFERALAPVDLHPASLSRSAILCVRALRDCSRRLSFRTTPDFADLNRWRQTTVAALDTLARGAARPSHGPVPATAEAVLFADETELLACLALDWCRGRFAELWWWRGLFANRPCPSWTAVWLKKPELIPAAVELLAEQREVDALARNVTSAEARQLLAAVVERFGLREIAVVLSRAKVESAPVETRLAQEITPPSGEGELRDPVLASAQVPALAMPVRPPWQRWVAETEVPPDLGVDEQAWLGIALVLQRAPRWARSAQFAEAIRKWIIASARSSEARLPALRGIIARPPLAKAKDTPTSTRTVRETPHCDRDAKGPAVSLSTRPSEETFVPREVRPVAGPPPMATPPAQAHERKGSSAVPVHRIEAGPSSPAIAPRDEQPSSSLAPRSEFLAAADSLPSSSEPFRHPSQPREREIETNFGGVFYLLNAALQLGLYGDFTTPMQPGLALPVWDFLALAGRELAGPDFAGDPLWQLLAELDERSDDESPGAEFDAPDCWQVPADWLKAFPEASVWHWSVQSGRMRIEHPEGFMIVDLPTASETTDAQLRSVAEAYASLSFELCLAPLTSGPSQLQRLGADSQLSTFNSQLPARCADSQLSTLRVTALARNATHGGNSQLPSPLQRWLDWLCGYLRARLPRALGFPTGSTAALTLLLEQPARVQTTATYVRVFFSLAQHPLEIRVAGLDRDPGWVPAAGRNFAFYYE
jgi:hypothetical protein